MGFPSTTPRARLTSHQRRAVLILLLLVPVLALCFVGNQEIFNAYLLWGKDHYDLVFRGQSMPVSWLLSLDAFTSTGAIFGSLLFWRWMASKGREPNETIKIAIGALIAALAPLSLAVGSWVMGGAKLGLVWGLGFHIINNVGFANIYAIGLALYSRASPRSITATVVSVFSLSIFCANLLDGKLAGLLSSMTPTSFWTMHAALVALGGVLMLIASQVFHSTLAPRDEAERSS
jgi:POT family proton-dependent oligopeptide transporter